MVGGMQAHQIEKDLETTSGDGQLRPGGMFRVLWLGVHRDDVQILGPEVIEERVVEQRQHRAEGSGRLHGLTVSGAHLVDELVEVLVAERVADEEHVPRHQHRLHHPEQRPARSGQAQIVPRE